VRIDGTRVQYKPCHFDEIKEHGVLSSGVGRAEVLLTPGVFLRIGDQSSVRMLDNRLVNTRVDVLSGNVAVESDDPEMSVKDAPVTLLYRNYEIRLVKHGFLEIGTNPAQMQVYNGEVIVTNGNDKVTVKEGRTLSFTGALITDKFDKNRADRLTVWARDRSQFLSATNIASARDLGSAFSGSNWYFNAYFGAFTFIPRRGTAWNPWGFGFFSPNTIRYYQVPPNFGTGIGLGIDAANREIQHPGRPGSDGSMPVQSSTVSPFGQRGTDPANSNSAVNAAGQARGNSMPVVGSPIRSGANAGAPPPPPPAPVAQPPASDPGGRGAATASGR
jgi:hypothetical protein